MCLCKWRSHWYNVKDHMPKVPASDGCLLPVWQLFIPVGGEPIGWWLRVRCLAGLRVNCCPKWMSLSISGSSSQLRVRWSMKLTGRSIKNQQWRYFTGDDRAEPEGQSSQLTSWSTYQLSSSHLVMSFASWLKEWSQLRCLGTWLACFLDTSFWRCSKFYFIW